jgi:hypothetical protein
MNLPIPQPLRIPLPTLGSSLAASLSQLRQSLEISFLVSQRNKLKISMSLSLVKKKKQKTVLLIAFIYFY